jgi:hypothetical protein
MSWVLEIAARITKTRSAYRITARNPAAKWTFGRLWMEWENADIEMDFRQLLLLLLLLLLLVVVVVVVVLLLLLNLLVS